MPKPRQQNKNGPRCPELDNIGFCVFEDPKEIPNVISIKTKNPIVTYLCKYCGAWDL